MISTYLQQVVKLHKTVGDHHSIERFVLEHGQAFTVVAPKRSFVPWVQRANQCFCNCIQLAYMERLVYVEGFATLPEPAIEMHHAWCLDSQGRVVDPTWKEPALAYFGVPFAVTYVHVRYDDQARYGMTGSLLSVGDDDYALVMGKEMRAWRAPARTIAHTVEVQR